MRGIEQSLLPEQQLYLAIFQSDATDNARNNLKATQDKLHELCDDWSETLMEHRRKIQEEADEQIHDLQKQQYRARRDAFQAGFEDGLDVGLERGRQAVLTIKDWVGVGLEGRVEQVSRTLAR